MVGFDRYGVNIEIKNDCNESKKRRLNSQQIADELSLSQDIISWLAGTQGEEQPSDVGTA